MSIVYAEAEPLPEHIKDYIDCAREIISTSGNCLDLLMNEELYEN